jgi:uncharacterized protein (UPF0333 family)
MCKILKNKSLFKRQKGEVSVEYALMTALVVVPIIAAMGPLNKEFHALIDEIAAQVINVGAELTMVWDPAATYSTATSGVTATGVNTGAAVVTADGDISEWQDLNIDFSEIGGSSQGTFMDWQGDGGVDSTADGAGAEFSFLAFDGQYRTNNNLVSSYNGYTSTYTHKTTTPTTPDAVVALQVTDDDYFEVAVFRTAEVADAWMTGGSTTSYDNTLANVLFHDAQYTFDDQNGYSNMSSYNDATNANYFIDGTDTAMQAAGITNPDGTDFDMAANYASAGGGSVPIATTYNPDQDLEVGSGYNPSDTINGGNDFSYSQNLYGMDGSVSLYGFDAEEIPNTQINLSDGTSILGTEWASHVNNASGSSYNGVAADALTIDSYTVAGRNGTSGGGGGFSAYGVASENLDASLMAVRDVLQLEIVDASGDTYTHTEYVTTQFDFSESYGGYDLSVSADDTYSSTNPSSYTSLNSTTSAYNPMPNENATNWYGGDSDGDGVKDYGGYYDNYYAKYYGTADQRLHGTSSASSSNPGVGNTGDINTYTSSDNIAEFDANQDAAGLEMKVSIADINAAAQAAGNTDFNYQSGTDSTVKVTTSREYGMWAQAQSDGTVKYGVQADTAGAVWVTPQNSRTLYYPGGATGAATVSADATLANSIQLDPALGGQVQGAALWAGDYSGAYLNTLGNIVTGTMIAGSSTTAIDSLNPTSVDSSGDVIQGSLEVIRQAGDGSMENNID